MKSYMLDIDGANGTPFRFIYWPEEDNGTVRYYDRRHVALPDQPHYHPLNHNEHGQSCGGPLDLSVFLASEGQGLGMRGWHNVDAWDVDSSVMSVVGSWLALVHRRAELS